MHRYAAKMTAIGLALGLAAATAHGQEPEEDLAAKVDRLEKGQAQIRQQLQQILTLLQQRQAPARPAGPNVAGKVFDVGDNPVKGASSARLTLIEFTDYQ